MNKELRADKVGEHRTAYEKNKRRIFQTQKVCALCGRPVDFKLKYPDPLSPCIDHIIPIARGGHPSDISNLQLAHWTCNRQKADRLEGEGREGRRIGTKNEVISNRVLPLTFDWKNYKVVG